MPLRLYLISKWRTSMAGQWFKMRGINDEGETANFVETDQILAFKDARMAVTVIRGSVPSFWT